MREEEQILSDDEEYINLGLIIRSYLRTLKKTWYLLIPMVLIAVGGLYFFSGSQQEEPVYYATIYYSVESGSPLETNKEVTARIANGLHTIVATPDFQKDLSDAMGVEAVNPGFWYLTVLTPSSNLFNVTLTSNDSNELNDIMKAFEEVYPLWVTKSIGNTKVVVIDEAVNTGFNYSGMPLKNIAIFGCGGAAAVWFGLVTLLVLLSHKIHNQSEMNQIVETECLGTLSNVRKKRQKKNSEDPLLISNRNVDLRYLQSVRTCRDLIEREVQNGKHVFMLTSAMPKEGKSLTTANLAYALIKRGKKVVIVDADIYSAGLSKLLQIPEETEGFSDYLCDKKKEQIHIYWRNNLAVAAAGTKREEGYSHLNVQNMRSLLDGLKKNADVVFLDTPAAGISGDAMMCTEVVDESIFVVRCDYADRKDIRKFIVPFYETQKLGGYILNWVVESAHDSKGNNGNVYSLSRNGGTHYPKKGSCYIEKKAGKDRLVNTETTQTTEEVWKMI